MSSSGVRDRQWSAARRVAARSLHPDRGGDPDAFIAALAALDNAYGYLPDSDHDASPVVIVRHPRWRRMTSATRQVRRRMRGTRHRYARL